MSSEPSKNKIRKHNNNEINIFPVIYLMSIGRVKDLRATFNIGKEYADNMIVCKSGFSDNFKERLQDHKEKYGAMPGTNIEVLWYSCVDPKYTREAETDLFESFGKIGVGFRFSHKKYKELLIFSKNDLKVVMNRYDGIANKYAGFLKEMKEEINNLEKEILLLNEKHAHQISDIHRECDKKLHEKDGELHEKDIKIITLENDNKLMKINHKIEIKDLTTEILTLKKKLKKYQK